MVAPLAILAIGAGLKTGGQIFGGIEAKRQAKSEARALNNQAALEQREAEFNALQTDRQFIELMAEQRAAAAASGVTLEGAPMAIIRQTQRDKEETLANIRSAGRARAGILARQAKDAKRRGRAAFISGISGGISGGIGSAGKLGDIGG